MIKRWLYLLCLLGLVLVGCDMGETEVTATETAVSPPSPTQPAAPTPEPTAAPTNTPEPTATSTGDQESPLSASVPDPLVQGTNGMPWWNDTVFYEVFVRSFYDSDGDGVGDINGLIEKLDYLNDGDPTTTDDLGVTGLWLMPIMESPSYHGYDVVDYYQVDQEYGTNEDFQRLMEEAHKRGMRVIVDLVLNHTSRDHPWFVDSRDPAGETRDWYVWETEDPAYNGPWGQEVWHRVPTGYYYGVFWDGMPDLNYTNPEVTETMLEATRFWLEDMGADGFRLDAIKHLIEDGRVQENTDETHEWLQGFYTFYKDVNPNALAVGEAWTSTQEVLDYTGDEVDIAFQFDLAADILQSSNAGRSNAVAKGMADVVESYPAGQYATFLTNHDQNRVMTYLLNNTGKATVAASILLTSPGVPFVYYGEEIGMTGMKPDEDIRRPMQWASDGREVGFTTGSPWRSPASDYDERSVALQTDDPESLLNHYRQLIHLRNAHAALRVGDWTQIETDPTQVYAFLRHTDDEVLLILINMSDEVITDYTLALETGPLATGSEAAMVLGEGTAQSGFGFAASPEVNASGGFTNYVPLESLPPHSTFIISLAPGS
jgi:glycosidase